MLKTIKATTAIYIFLFLISSLLFYGVKFKGHLFTAHLYEKGDFNTLNTITQAKDTGSLDFYIGEVENALLGPLGSMISGLLLLTFCLKFLKTANSFQFGLTILAYLVLTRPEVLLYPPFGEGITGPFSDTVWLVQNNLNYFGLLQQDTFTKGGPQIYPTLLYPLFVAVLMKILPVTYFLFTMHSLYFVITAVILSLVRHFSQKTFNNQILALLIPILILSLPLVQCMVELINLEVPSLFFTMLTVYYLSKNRIACASLASVAGLFVKEPTVIACAAVCIITILRYLVGNNLKQNYKMLIWPAMVISIVIVKSLLRAMMLGEQKSFNMICFLCGWRNTFSSIWFYIFILSLVSIALFSIKKIKILTNNSNSFFSALKETLRFLVYDKIHITLMLLLAALWFLLFLNFLTLAYRYQLLLMPFFIFSVCYASSLIIKNQRLLHTIMILVIIVSFLSSHGLMYSTPRGLTKDNKSECAPTDLERTLEYRNFIKLEMKLAKEIEENFSDYAIVAPFQTAQLLALPELGYVSKRLNVYVYGMKETLGIKPFTGLKDLNISKTIFVGYPHHIVETLNVPFPIDPQDKIIKKLESGHIPVYLFMGGIAIERMRLIVTISHQQKFLKELKGGK